ncbi:hypothetical protein C8F01DRAFT_1153703 [Mycena amicta]|nr:hypothetical protein C8F01DRAFT_1153703 [Mycena amicta]
MSSQATPFFSPPSRGSGPPTAARRLSAPIRSLLVLRVFPRRALPLNGAIRTFTSRVAGQHPCSGLCSPCCHRCSAEYIGRGCSLGGHDAMGMFLPGTGAFNRMRTFPRKHGGASSSQPHHLGPRWLHDIRTLPLIYYRCPFRRWACRRVGLRGLGSFTSHLNTSKRIFGYKAPEPMEPISVTPNSSEAHQLVLAARFALPLVLSVLFAVLPLLFFRHRLTFVVSKIYWFGITAYASSSLAAARDTHLRMGSLQLTCFALYGLTILIAQLARTTVDPPVWDLQWIWESLTPSQHSATDGPGCAQGA